MKRRSLIMGGEGEMQRDWTVSFLKAQTREGEKIEPYSLAGGSLACTAGAMPLH